MRLLAQVPQMPQAQALEQRAQVVDPLALEPSAQEQAEVLGEPLALALAEVLGELLVLAEVLGALLAPLRPWTADRPDCPDCPRCPRKSMRLLAQVPQMPQAQALEQRAQAQAAVLVQPLALAEVLGGLLAQAAVLGGLLALALAAMLVQPLAQAAVLVQPLALAPVRPWTADRPDCSRCPQQAMRLLAQMPQAPQAQVVEQRALVVGSLALGPSPQAQDWEQSAQAQAAVLVQPLALAEVLGGLLAQAAVLVQPLVLAPVRPWTADRPDCSRYQTTVRPWTADRPDCSRCPRQAMRLLAQMPHAPQAQVVEQRAQVVDPLALRPSALAQGLGPSVWPPVRPWTAGRPNRLRLLRETSQAPQAGRSCRLALFLLALCSRPEGGCSTNSANHPPHPCLASPTPHGD